jgi:hypothetical protein
MSKFIEFDYYPDLDLKANPGYRMFNKSKLIVNRDFIIAIAPYIVDNEGQFANKLCAMMECNGFNSVILAEEYEQVKQKLL